MRRVIVLLSLLTVAVLLGVSTAQAAPAQRGPQPATIRAKTATDTGAPGALVPVAGTLRDAKQRPLTGALVMAYNVWRTILGHERSERPVGMPAAART